MQVRHADYDEPVTLGAAFSGVDKLLLVSGKDPVRRGTQHRAGCHSPSPSCSLATDVDVADGLFDETSGELSELIGRPTTTWRESLASIIGR